MRQRAGLQFAEFDEQRRVRDVDMRRNGQLEEFAEDHLRNEKHDFNLIILTRRVRFIETYNTSTM